MQFTILGSLLALSALSTAYEYASTAKIDALSKTATVNFVAHHFEETSGSKGECTEENLVRRKEWTTLSDKEKSDYIAANQCLLDLPARFNLTAPFTRVDDFVATHSEQALYIHNNGVFLAWHRFFVLAWEAALRRECGYQGHQPYLDWVKISHDPANAPIFNGNNISLGTNGAPSNKTTDTFLTPNGAAEVPSAGAGGCIDTGPFTNLSVNLGPAEALEYNSRCITRDLLTSISSQRLTDDVVATLITQSPNITTFQDSYQSVGNASDISTFGVHAAAHGMIGGNVQTDFWVSPSDPYFFLHHAQIDRLWWIWQNQDPATRTYAVGGNRTAFGLPYNGTVQLSDIMVVKDFETQDRTVESVLSTAYDDLCYLYE